MSELIDRLLQEGQAADRKVFREVQCDRIGDVEIGSLGSALLQNEICDFISSGLQRGAVFLIAQIGVFLIAVDGVASEGSAF